MLVLIPMQRCPCCTARTRFSPSVIPALCEECAAAVLRSAFFHLGAGCTEQTTVSHHDENEDARLSCVLPGIFLGSRLSSSSPQRYDGYPYDCGSCHPHGHHRELFRSGSGGGETYLLFAFHAKFDCCTLGAAVQGQFVLSTQNGVCSQTQIVMVYCPARCVFKYKLYCFRQTGFTRATLPAANR